ncbi:hypothetical protein GWK08_04540 [Leptobacterium flavescens]|uniref:PA14 domain-containing protein n=1 Tax=Leptobacterium flavescens TaxID=472055 RepID=A0A6P0UI80_9FLAO|nr:PA14 domain-containing protein [Leptobacterium flavescens]NER12697.1 hypothetical protein [Leptobacterium flavescens]
MKTTKLLKSCIALAVCFLFFNLPKIHAQVGIGTNTPEGVLDITNTSNGLLIPRVSLSSLTDTTTVQNPNGGSLAVSTLVYNDGTGGLGQSGFYYWDGAQWSLLRSNGDGSISGMQFFSFDIANTAQPDIDNPRELATPDLSGFYSGDLATTSFGTTDPSGNGEGFIVYFRGVYQVQNSGDFTFSLTSDDGSRLYIDDMLIVESWFDQSSTTRNNTINLAAGKHRFEFWYYENSGANSFSFQWGTNPDGNTGVIAASQFTIEQ